MSGTTFLHILGALLLWALVDADNTGPKMNWGELCPVSCTCHLGHSTDLLIKQWMEREEKKGKTRSKTTVANEAFYENDMQDENKGELLKIAICIIQSNTDPEKVLQQLPGDTQALTILQSHGSQEIILDATHTRHFQQLEYLHIQGYQPEAKIGRKKNLDNHKLVLFNNVLRPITSLKYLSLEHIKILPGSIISNEIDQGSNSYVQNGPHDNEISTHPLTERGRKSRRPGKGPIPNLVFAMSNTSQSELVPYKIYKEQQERARLSIFVGLTNLELLRVIDCGLHEVYWEMFHGLNKIEYLSLESNELLFLPEFAFYGTPHLKILSLAHNKLLNIQSTGLAGLLELQILDLSHNNFSHLSEFSLPPFPNLQAAYLWHNPIEAVFASTFEIMNATTALYIGGDNTPLELHPSSFQGLICLKILELLNVRIGTLERELLTGMPQLRQLKASGEISSISFDAFLDVPLLETLELQHCKIKSVSMDAFYGLYKLSVLDLSNNLLQSLPIGVFDQLFSLRELYLQNNSLTELPEGFFTTLTAKMVRLEGNSWHCTCNMKNWLAAATNRIKEVKTTSCAHEYDKGVKCLSQEVAYIYEKSVAPKCHKPEKYNGWNIYHVVRKELRCGKLIHKKFNRKEYLKKKFKEYENTNKESGKNYSITYIHSKSIPKSKDLKDTKNTTFMANRKIYKNQHGVPAIQEKQKISNVITDESKILREPTVLNSTIISDILDNFHLPENNILNNKIMQNTLPLLPQKTEHVKYFPPKDTQLTPHNPNILHMTQTLVPTHKFNNNKMPVDQESKESLKPSHQNNPKQLKKIMKSELQRKHQGKLKNFQENFKQNVH